MTISKLQDGTYQVRTGRFTADLREIAGQCELKNDALHSITKCVKGEILTMPSFLVKLGPVTLPAVRGLNPGEVYEQE